MRLAPGLVLGLVVSATVAAVACSEGQAVQPPSETAPLAVPVTAAPAVHKDIPLEVSVIGTVEAHSTVAVRAQMTGELTSVNFQQGDDVRAGQELFTLDRRPLEAALQQAAANLERDTAQAANAKVIVQRYEELVQRGIVAREQRDTARATVAALEGTLAADRAALENAKVQLQYATIRAPISGRTGALMVNVGNLVRANDQTPLVVINQVTPIYVSFAFPEALLSGPARSRSRAPFRTTIAGSGPASSSTS
jgi:multidrug efflux system membrane fusion protein